MLPALIQKIDVRGVLDVGRGHCGIHNQLAAILLFLASLFLGCVGILLSLSRFSTGRLVIIPVIIVIGCCVRFIYVIAVHIPLILRPFFGTDVLIDSSDFFYGKSLPEMHHHGRVKQRFLLKLMESQKVLHVRILLDFCNTFSIGKVSVLFDKYRAEGYSGRICSAARFRVHGTQVDLFNMVPGHNPSQPHPAILRVKSPAEGHGKILYNKLVLVLNIIHAKHPRITVFPQKPLFLAAFIILHSGLFLNVFSQNITDCLENLHLKKTFERFSVNPT